jgi:hypothetical protein
MLEFETIILGLQVQQWDKTPVMEEKRMRVASLSRAKCEIFITGNGKIGPPCHLQ